MATKRPRYMISVDNEMFDKIEDFRFEKRFQTRSEATAELIRLGLEAIEEEQEEAKKAKKSALSSEKIAMAVLEKEVCHYPLAGKGSGTTTLKADGNAEKIFSQMKLEGSDLD